MEMKLEQLTNSWMASSQDHQCVWYWKHRLCRVNGESCDIRVLDVQLREMIPYDLKSFYGMSPCLAFTFRENRKHASLIEDYAEYSKDLSWTIPARTERDLEDENTTICNNTISGIDTYLVITAGSYHAKFNQFRLQPNPTGLRPSCWRGEGKHASQVQFVPNTNCHARNQPIYALKVMATYYHNMDRRLPGIHGALV